MTATEFAMKHQVDYQIVYSASFNTRTRKEKKQKDIPEAELMEAVRAELQGRVEYYGDKERKYRVILESLK